MATIKYLNENGDYEEVSTIKIVEEGGGGESGGGSQMEYWKVEATTDMQNVVVLMACSTLVRGQVDGEVVVVPVGLRSDVGIYLPEALALDRSADIVIPVQIFTTVGDLLNEQLPDLEAAGFTPMTKEEFYAV